MGIGNWLMPGGRAGVGVTAAVMALAVVLHVPAALAFPYRTQIGATSILSERPIDPSIEASIARADRLLAASPIAVPGIERQLVLTDGGWRWRMLAIGSAGAIALRRPFGNAMIFNRSDVAADRVSNGAAIGGIRTLSGTIAHEMVHLLIARRYGEWRAMRSPSWLVEGYADHVAGETSIGGAADEVASRRADPATRVLVYYEGRRRVAKLLRSNGGSVDALFDRRTTPDQL